MNFDSSIARPSGQAWIETVSTRKAAEPGTDSAVGSCMPRSLNWLTAVALAGDVGHVLCPTLYLDSDLPIIRRNPRLIIGPETGQDVRTLRPLSLLRRSSPSVLLALEFERYRRSASGDTLDASG